MTIGELARRTGLAVRTLRFYRTDQPGAVDAMMGFDDRDLLRLAEQAGFDRSPPARRRSRARHRPGPRRRPVRRTLDPG
jgi:hypothetical protein